METIINLFGEYKAVLLPKDVKGVDSIRQLDGTYLLNYWQEMKEHKGWYEHQYVNLGKQFWIIGTLDTLTEEQAREIVGDRSECYGTTINYLKYFFSLKGIKTKNPLKKPYLNDDKYRGNFGNFDKAILYKRDLSAWEASERETKQIVIIKTK